LELVEYHFVWNEQKQSICVCPRMLKQNQFLFLLVGLYIHVKMPGRRPEPDPRLDRLTKLGKIYVISTNVESGRGYDYFSGDFLKLYRRCPDEVAILIHGLDNSWEAYKDFERASMSIEANGYDIPTIGVLWPSNTDDLKTAKANATKVGPKLANFLTDFKDKCDGTALRIVAFCRYEGCGENPIKFEFRNYVDK
jgi:hypothetical protein